MNHRLGNLQLLNPPSRGVWTGSGLHSASRTISRKDGRSVRIDAPLFWYEPAWIRLPADIADLLAIAVAQQNVTVSALLSDLMDDQQESDFFAKQEAADRNGDAAEPFNPAYLPRMTPYRAERYGLLAKDFDHTQIVDVRLAPTRDHSGRLAYSPQQLERWERPVEDTHLAGGGYVAAAPFPADVVTLKQLAIKLDQIRSLATQAAVIVSIGPLRLENDLAAALVAKPDGILVRFNECHLEGLQLAALVARCRKYLVDNGFAHLPLWIVPGDVTPDDVAKLIALGASAVAVDAWCNPLVQRLESEVMAAAYSHREELRINEMVAQHLWDDVDRVLGLLSSIPVDCQVDKTLGTFNAKWATACGVSLLS